MFQGQGKTGSRYFTDKRERNSLKMEGREVQRRQLFGIFISGIKFNNPLHLKESSRSQVWKIEIFPAVTPEKKKTKKENFYSSNAIFIPYGFVVWGYFLALQNEDKKLL